MLLGRRAGGADGHHTQAVLRLGYTLGRIGNTPISPAVFGMVGIGGSAAYADLETGITVAVTKNRFNPAEMNAFDQVYALVTKELSAA
ncbi:hypothetical protein [Dactylosporangium fulvum]|uniref:Beta-lactamase n=1 Tax=Dactylosporangium fulvum TaxID=53359 RepID=A0ABY5W273_9ACTN|nr:hypothetical protein [Dactylosporangium fulvum]UWP83206.1 hypothetical protein Dfulv_02545 [Dactylosporangium fulvum]